MALLLTVAVYAGLSASSPAQVDASALRDPFAAPPVASVSATRSSDLVDPFARPRAAAVARTSIELVDPFALRSPEPDHELRDPFAARRPARVSSSSTPDLYDPFAR
jgi:hypothetical protein